MLDESTTGRLSQTDSPTTRELNHSDLAPPGIDVAGSSAADLPFASLQTGQPSKPVVRAWDPLRSRLFLAFWCVGFVSNLGTWMHELAAAYYMTLLEGTPFWVSMVRTAMSAPVFFFALFAGVVADRVDRRRLLVGTQLYLCGVTSLMSVMTLLDWMTPAGLLGFTFAIGLGICVHIPTWQSLLPRIVTRAQIPAAIGLGSISFNLARCLGPAISGLAIGAFGIAFSFAANAVSFLAVMCVLVWWQSSERRGQQSTKVLSLESAPLAAEKLRAQKNGRYVSSFYRDPPTLGIFASLKEGLLYLFAQEALRNVFVRVMVYVVPGSIVWALIPLVARDKYHLDATGLGLLISAFGLGAVCGAFLLARLRQSFSADSIVPLMTILFALGCLPIAFSDRWWIAAMAMAIIGVSWMGNLTTFNSTIQLNLEDRFRARGLSLYLTIISFSLAFGPLFWGLLAEQKGTDFAFVCAAIGSPIVYIFSRRFKLIEM